jgi:hypothetical protein
MATALVVSVALHMWAPFSGSGPLVFAKSALLTTVAATIVWVAVTLVTPPEPQDVLVRFYRHVRPHVAGWKRVAALAPDVPATRDLGRNLLAWVLGCAMVYATLFAIGEFCFGRIARGVVLFLLAAVCAALIYADISRRFAPAAGRPEDERIDRSRGGL